MPRADAIQPMMFRIPGDVDLSASLHQTSMPEEWTRLFEAVWPPQNRGPRIPYGALGASLRLLFPQIAHIGSMSGSRMTRDGWLYAWERPGPDQFMALMEEWIRIGGTGKSPATIIEQIHWNDLSWNERDLGFHQYSIKENGSPELSSLHYNALPDLLCSKLAERETSLGEHRPLTFRRAYYGRTPHLISWPPVSDVRRQVAWHWSYVLTPRIVNFPGTSEPYLSISPSVRRWASRTLRRDNGRYDLPYPDATSVYVEVDDPWMSAQTGTRATSLVGIPLKLNITREENRTVRTPRWDTPVDRVLRGLMADPELPDTVELADDPVRFLHRQRGSVGITLPSHNTAHQVRVGMPFADRRDIYRSVSGLLYPLGFDPTDPSLNIQIPRARKKSLLRTKYTEIPGERIVGSIQRSLGDRLMIEVLYQTDTTRSALRSEIWRRLLQGRPSHEPPPGDSATLGGVEVQVSFRALGALGSRLDGSGRSAETRRMDEVKASFDHSDVPTGCLVELQEADYFGSADPKHAIRRGLAMTGRLSQFITPITETDAGKVDGPMSARSAVADILRQLGNMPDAPFDVPSPGFPSDIRALGVWVYKDGNRPRLPILVDLPSRSQVAAGEKPVRVMLRTGSRTGEWYSYPQAQLEIGSGAVPDTEGDVGTVLKRMLGEAARSVTADGVPLLMLCDTENVRRLWPELQNQNLVIGRRLDMPWSVGDLDPRMVRINTSGSEVPQWFEESLSWPTGVFRAPGIETYFSLGAKPASLSSTKWRVSKRDRPFDRHASTRICEVVLVQLHEDDDSIAWVGAVHRLREMAAHFNDTLQLPLPLHLAKLTEEYMPRVSNTRPRRRRRR